MHFYGPLADTKVVAYDFIELPFGDSENDLFFTGRQRIIDFRSVSISLPDSYSSILAVTAFLTAASKRSGLADFEENQKRRVLRRGRPCLILRVRKEI